jgi:hypothetical protein
LRDSGGSRNIPASAEKTVETPDSLFHCAFASDPRRVEQLSDADLAALAREQREQLNRVAWPRERAVERLRQIIEGRARAGANDKPAIADL